MHNFALIVALCLSVFLVDGAEIQVKKCKNEKIIGELVTVDISGCTKHPCKLKKNTNVNCTFVFKPTEEVKDLTAHVYGYVLGVPLPFPGFHRTNAKKNVFTKDGSNTTFPLKVGEEYVYRNSFPVLRIYPQLGFDVYWALKNPRQEAVFCFQVPVRIVA